MRHRQSLDEQGPSPDQKVYARVTRYNFDACATTGKKERLMRSLFPPIPHNLVDKWSSGVTTTVRRIVSWPMTGHSIQVTSLQARPAR